jgi:hypothetical protein
LRRGGGNARRREGEERGGAQKELSGGKRTRSEAEGRMRERVKEGGWDECRGSGRWKWRRGRKMEIRGDESRAEREGPISVAVGVERAQGVKKEMIASWLRG